MHKLTNEEFIAKAQEIHGDKYDYSNSTYINSSVKICIGCSKHGGFWQLPSVHLLGHGCPICANEEKSKTKTDTKDTFINKAIHIHGKLYDYSKVNYINSQTKTCIICPKHGEFWQKPNNHIMGQGCPVCSQDKKKDNLKSTTESFIKKAEEIHGDKYEYSNVKYINSKTKVCIICHKHGEFWQTPNSHLNGQGCPKCVGRNKTTDEWISAAKEIHEDKYGYSKVKYINATTKVCIICNKHGEFWQEPTHHLSGCGCQNCATTKSSPENEIIETLKPLECKQSYKKLLNGKEIDIYIPSLKLGIEYNGLLWHSEAYGRDKNYHLNKLEECENKGVKLIQIFEDEWIKHKESCKNTLKLLCGLVENFNKVDINKCKIDVINNKEEIREFLKENDINSYPRFSVGIGAYYNDDLIYVMLFLKRKNVWILNRCTPKINYLCFGLEKSIFDFFTQQYQPTEIDVFVDRRWIGDFSNNTFTKMGLHLDSYLPPQCYFYNTNMRFKRFKKNIFKHSDILTKIWDCGFIKFKWVAN